MRKTGFTLIEVLVTMAIVSMILTLAVPRYFSNVDRTREEVLRQDLYIMRDAIDKYYSDKNRYPGALEDLVSEKYLRALPVDPYTKTASSWIVVPPEGSGFGAVADVRSGATVKARDGSWLKDW